MPDAPSQVQGSAGEVRRTREHVEGCFAPFVGKECDCGPETVWVPLSVAEKLATAIREHLAAIEDVWDGTEQSPLWGLGNSLEAAVDAYRAAYPREETT